MRSDFHKKNRLLGAIKFHLFWMCLQMTYMYTELVVTENESMQPNKVYSSNKSLLLPESK